MTSLTKHLKSLNCLSFQAAARHDFPTQAKLSTLSEAELMAWLYQDLGYAKSYDLFIGTLLVKTQSVVDEAATESLQARFRDCLQYASSNIKREIAMFESILDRGESIEISESQKLAVQKYDDLFSQAGSGDKSLLYGLVVLWTTEVYYMEAWVPTELPGDIEPTKSTQVMEDVSGSFSVREALQMLKLNWTSIDFQDFVSLIEHLVDEVHALTHSTEGEVNSLEEACGMVLQLEDQFWPSLERTRMIEPFSSKRGHSV